MSRLSLFLVSVLSLFLYTGAWADDTTTTTTVVEKHTIVTPAPKSAKCTTVNGHWEGNIWVDTQTVCSYENRTEGTAWVQDYWACTVFTSDGTCSSWEYRPGHWVKTLP